MNLELLKVKPAKVSLASQAMIKKFVGKRQNRGVVIEVPAKQNFLFELNRADFKPGVEIFLVVSPGAKLTVIDYRQTVSAASTKVTLISGAESQVDYLVASVGLKSDRFFYQAYPGPKAAINWYVLGRLTGQDYDFTLATDHRAVGSTGKMTVALDFRAHSRSAINLISNHQGQKTRGEINFKGLGRDQARAFITGLIKIGKKGVETDAYLQQDILLTSSSAEIDAKPNLEILNNEVKASHAATLASFDPAALFYLNTRGLDNRGAEQVLINGFFDSLTSKITNTTMVQEFKEFWQ